MSVADLRAAMGLGAQPSPLADEVRRSGVGWHPAVALGLLAMVDQFHGHALVVLGPEVARALGLPRPALAGMLTLSGLAFTLAALPMAAFVGRRAARGMVSAVTGILWSGTTAATAFVAGGWGLTGVTVLDGATSGSVQAVHPPLLADLYPASARVRMQALYRGMDAFGNVVGPLLVAGLTATAGLSWRGVFLVLGLVSLLCTLPAVRLRDPGFGRWDVARARSLARGDGSPDEEEPPLGLLEVGKRLLLISTYRRVLAGSAAIGMLLAPLNVYLFFFLDERWNLGPAARGVFFAAAAAASGVAMLVVGPIGESLFARDPALIVKAAAAMLAAGLAVLCLSVLAPAFPVMAVLFAASSALFAGVYPFLTATVMVLVPARMRPHATAVRGVFRNGVGGVLGILLLGGVDQRFGTTGAILSIAAPGFLAAAVMWTASGTVNRDLDRMLEELADDEQVTAARERGEHFPRLSCRDLTVAYGPVRALRGVDLRVERGELVAVVGTNGAGKSTLLSAIAGTVLPISGSIRLDGRDITWLDAERRVSLGITTVRAGDAIFPSLSVADNLRLFAAAKGRGAAGVDAALGAFPVLAERRDHSAGTLSGGERQLLGLSRAVVATPSLLLIDELSLGLAPGAIEHLVAVVMELHAAGTTIVVVEQSVDLAVRIAPRAVFLERGEVRYDGSSSGLLDRPDLVRAVYLRRH